MRSAIARGSKGEISYQREHSDMRDSKEMKTPDVAFAHPGYACCRKTSRKIARLLIVGEGRITLYGFPGFVVDQTARDKAPLVCLRTRLRSDFVLPA